MIYTQTCDLLNYCGISTSLDTAIKYIQENELNKLNQGRNEIDGECVYVNRFGYETILEEEGFFEAHEQYVDIHMILEGEEKVGITPISSLEKLSYDRETDSAVYKGSMSQSITLTPGKVLIVFPEDAHMVKLKSSEKCTVDKIVFKVKIR